MRKTDKRTEENILKLKKFVNGIDIKLYDKKRGHIQTDRLPNKH